MSRYVPVTEETARDAPMAQGLTYHAVRLRASSTVRPARANSGYAPIYVPAVRGLDLISSQKTYYCRRWAASK